MCNPVQEIKNVGSSAVDLVKDVASDINREVIKPIVEVAQDAGRDVDDFVNEEIPGGWYTVGAIAGGAALGAGAGATGAAGGAAGGTGLTAGAGGVTGLTAGAGGVTGLTAGTGATLGGAIGGGLGAGAGSLLDPTTSAAGLDGALGTGLTADAGGIGLAAPTAPSVGSMGGGTGLLAPAAGGTGVVGATGVTAAGAVPILGDAASFINNPAVLGQPVVNYVAPSNALKSTLDTIRTANAVRGMLTPQQAQIPQMQFNQVPQGVVDYSPLLSLLSQRAQRPNIQSLLG